jgi:hypothetical protein
MISLLPTSRDLPCPIPARSTPPAVSPGPPSPSLPRLLLPSAWYRLGARCRALGARPWRLAPRGSRRWRSPAPALPGAALPPPSLCGALARPRPRPPAPAMVARPSRIWRAAMARPARPPAPGVPLPSPRPSMVARRGALRRLVRCAAPAARPPRRALPLPGAALSSASAWPHAIGLGVAPLPLAACNTARARLGPGVCAARHDTSAWPCAHVLAWSTRCFGTAHRALGVFVYPWACPSTPPPPPRVFYAR